MSKALRWAAYGLGGFVVFVLLAAAAVWLISSQRLHAEVAPEAEGLAPPTPAQLADAERQARVLGCYSCHGEGLRGNRMFDEPNVGTIWAPNLTQVAARASDQQLARAIRQGIGADGHSLFIMPSEVFQHLSDEEVAAMVARIRALPRGGSDTPPNTYGPIGRIGIVLGKFKTAPEMVADYSTREPMWIAPQYEAGRRLATRNCSGCHNADLSGKEVKPGEMSPDLMIAGAYDVAAFKTLLRTGKAAGGQKLKLMATIAKSDLSHMTDGEIAELHSYLQARAQQLSR